MLSEVKVIPDLEDQDTTQTWVPTEEEEKRGLRVHRRIDKLLDARKPYEPSIKRSLQLYSGRSRNGGDDPSKETVVAPYARIFVEAKTAEEVKAISEYEFVPVEDAGDGWKVELLKQVNTHVLRKTKWRAKKHQAIRMKNIAGVAIGRVGYRRIMRTIKERIQDNDEGDTLTWEEIEVPIYDDLFIDLVSPLSFAVDPNALTMDDAMDCVHFHPENFEVFWETYAKDKKFKNTDSVKPGAHGRFDEEGFSSGFFRGNEAKDNMVVITEYFNKLRDEWTVYANGVEIYYGPLPDDHKELPFFSYHNNPTFVSGTINALSYSSPASGNAVTDPIEVRSEETFWTEGDPSTIMDLIDLRTGFGRAAYKAIKLAGESIIATAGNFRFDESKAWKSGDQAIGAMGKYEVTQLGAANLGSFQFAFEDLTNLMILTTGVDPRSLSQEGNNKTATEAAIQRETSMRRLEQNIEYNEENGELRLGMLIHKVIQQRYTKPELVRLTGRETEDELDSFDDVAKDPNTKKPTIGKRFRRIRTNFNVKESTVGGKLTLKKDDAGVGSFIARPDYIRTSEVDIQVLSKKRVGTIQAIQIEQNMSALRLVAEIMPFTQPMVAGQEPLISVEDLPPVKQITDSLMTAMGMSGSKQGGDEDDEIDETFAELQKSRVPITDVAPDLNAAI